MKCVVGYISIIKLSDYCISCLTDKDFFPKENIWFTRCSKVISVFYILAIPHCSKPLDAFPTHIRYPTIIYLFIAIINPISNHFCCLRWGTFTSFIRLCTVINVIVFR